MPPARAAGAAATHAPSSDLSPWRWRDRLLLVFAPDPADADLAAQRAMLRDTAPDRAARDLVAVEIVGDRASDPRLDGASLRRAYGVASGRFVAVLIGKDGGEKLRRDGALSGKRLFATIDRMPMRRREMQQQRGPAAAP